MARQKKAASSLDKPAPQTEVRTAARQAEQDEANAEQPELVQPGRREPITNDTEIVDAILTYLDTFPNGGRTDFWLVPIRKYIDEGRSAE